MPLVTRQIRAAQEYADASLCANSTFQFALDDAAQADRTGVLAQLAALAEHSAEIFAGLQALTNDTHNRISSLAARVGSVTAGLQPVEARLASIKTTSTANVSKLDREDTTVMQLFTAESRDATLAELYEAAEPAPPLGLLDKFRPDNMKHFSNPGFFLEQYQESLRLKAEAKRQAKAERKALRHARREKNRQRKEAERKRRPSNAVASMDWRASVGPAGQARRTTSARMSNVRVAEQATNLAVSADVAFAEDSGEQRASDDVDYAAIAAKRAASQPRTKPQPQPRQAAPAVKPRSQQATIRESEDESDEDTGAAGAALSFGAEDVAVAGSAAPPRETKPAAAPAPAAAPTPAPAARAKPRRGLQRGLSLREIAAPRAEEAGDVEGESKSAGSAAPASGGGTAARPPAAGGARLNLLAAIRSSNTKQLRKPKQLKVQKPAPAPSARSSLLEQIRQAKENKKLKHVSPEEVARRKEEARKKEEAAKAAAAPTTRSALASALAQRRRAFGSDSDSSESSDSDSD